MRLHLPSLPHTQTTRAYSTCAYTEKVRKFADMMTGLGHTVILYASEDNEARCAEHVVAITKPEQAELCPHDPEQMPTIRFDPAEPAFALMNQRVSDEIKQRRQRTWAAKAEPRDVICIIGGSAQQPIAAAFPETLTVEYGVGYPGVFSHFRVFESYAWMHTVYGATQGADSDGRFYDAVIPNSFEPDAFPLVTDKDDYLLFVGRLIDRKGLDVACQVAERTGKRLVVAGQGTPPDQDCVDYIGVLDPEARAKVMGHAAALICPTLYIEPFGGVAVEAQMCGTPVISTDWGAFVETVEQGVTGWRCRTLGEFCWAAEHAHLLDPETIATRARALYSVDVIALAYQRYFERLGTLYEDGWYSSGSWLRAEPA